MSDFLGRLEEHPDDWDTYLVFADWLDEQGKHALAHAFRWCGRRKRRPARNEMLPAAAMNRWRWFRTNSWSMVDAQERHPYACLESWIIEDEQRHGMDWVGNVSLLEAMEWLAAQLDELRKLWQA